SSLRNRNAEFRFGQLAKDRAESEFGATGCYTGFVALPCGAGAIPGPQHYGKELSDECCDTD
ncbi:MAG TPA: hypothetical protein PLI07_14910, partial [Candidatus Hydrogenedentes bacterium]|nr:hypothetical protein [Candidatus Hydrogenedentota bacterium]